MNNFVRDMANTAVVVLENFEVANAIQSDVFERYEGAEMLEVCGGNQWWCVLYDTASGYEHLQEFITYVDDLITDVGGVSENTAVF
jgi:hypothetical protein